MDETTDPTGKARDNTLPTSAQPAGNQGDRIEYGGGLQPGGGMVEPDEFDEAIDEPGLPNDALAEGRSIRRATPPEGGSVEPDASPDPNDTGDRMGDVAGYVGSDQVVGAEGPDRRPADAEDSRTGG